LREISESIQGIGIAPAMMTAVTTKGRRRQEIFNQDEKSTATGMAAVLSREIRAA
jgi:hypothetical protein